MSLEAKLKNTPSILKSSRIALYGGSFDPFHYGHFKIIQTLFSLDISQLILMPTFCNPFKSQSFLPPELRFVMCQRVADQCQEMGLNLVACDFEVRQERVVFSIESVEYVRKYFSDSIFFVLGQDSFEKLWQWKDVERLCALVDFVVVGRNSLSVGHQKIESARVYRYLNIEYNSSTLSSSYIRELLHCGKSTEALKLIPDFLHDLMFEHLSL